MSELKTLKDIDLFEPLPPISDYKDIQVYSMPRALVSISDLRQEAIKWIKAMRRGDPLPVVINMNLHDDQSPSMYFRAIEDFLTYFYNITDEDLK